MAIRQPKMHPPSVALLLVALAAAAGAARHPRMPHMMSLRQQDDYVDCGGQQTSCYNSTALQICADLGTGYVPVSIFPCPTSGTPYCSEGRCVPAVTPAPPTPAPTPYPDDGVCGGKLSFCADCYTRTVCARLGKGIVPVSNVTCGAEAPYCVDSSTDGQCQPDLPADSTCEPIPVPESKFKCYGDGYFPDAASCNRYHLCLGAKAYDYDCPRGLVYDQSRALCTPSAACSVFDCRGRVGQYQVYPPDNSLYALCVSDDSNDALVASCPTGHRLNSVDPSNVHCEAYCPRVGRFADPDDKTGAAYWECLASYVRGELVGPIPSTCPGGSLFDALTERCQPIIPSPSNKLPITK